MPNYELDPTNIKRSDLGPLCTEHITLQHLEKPKGADPVKLAESIERGGLQPSTVDLNVAFGYGAHLDVQFCGPPPPLPPTLILDYVHGVAAYNRWRSSHDEVHPLMKDYRNANYARISPLPRQNVDPFEQPFNPPDDLYDPD
ncbi:hypothetical protein OG21DRAFT_1487924 [Imleria badia]|nr:hypothetical protein OG21DRAFT_1487924 [Imleria badia]